MRRNVEALAVMLIVVAVLAVGCEASYAPTMPSVDNTPTNDSPVNDSPVNDSPVNDAPLNDAPVNEAR